MPIGMRYQNPDVQARIARDYVAGALSLAARRRCEALRRELPELDRQIYRWEAHLQPLAEALPEQAPANAVWESIETSLNFAPADAKDTQPPLTAWWNRLGFLRTFALAASLAVVALSIAQFNRVAPPSVDYVAVLTDDAGAAQFVATASESTRQLDIRVFGDDFDPDSDYQLWALSKTDGEVRSLGLVDVAASSQRVLETADWRLITDARELFVTEEMPGGSAIGEPSDVVLSRGLCVLLSTS